MYHNMQFEHATTKNEDIDFLRHLLADMLEQQSSPRLNTRQQDQCKRGIKALRSAIDALEVQVYA